MSHISIVYTVSCLLAPTSTTDSLKCLPGCNAGRREEMHQQDGVFLVRVAARILKGIAELLEFSRVLQSFWQVS